MSGELAQALPPAVTKIGNSGNAAPTKGTDAKIGTNNQPDAPATASAVTGPSNAVQQMECVEQTEQAAVARGKGKGKILQGCLKHTPSSILAQERPSARKKCTQSHPYLSAIYPPPLSHAREPQPCCPRSFGARHCSRCTDAAWPSRLQHSRLRSQKNAECRSECKLIPHLPSLFVLRPYLVTAALPLIHSFITT